MRRAIKAKPTRRIGLGGGNQHDRNGGSACRSVDVLPTAKYYVKESVIAAKPGAETEKTFAAELDTIDRLFRSLTVYSNSGR